MTLADLEAYEARHGTVSEADAPTIVQLLADASSLVQTVARLTIEAVTDDVVTVDGDGSRRLILPEIPVTGVASVEVDGEVVDPDAYRWWEWGGLDRRDHRRWPVGARNVEVTYSHGWDPVPDWVVAIVCSMVREVTREHVITGEQSVTTGSQTVSYFTARSNLFVPAADEARLVSLRGPVL